MKQKTTIKVAPKKTSSLVGKKAPDFKLLDQYNVEHKLSDYRGKVVLLYFYPKDLTTGCTIEAEIFRDMASDFRKQKVTVFGASADSVASHKKFAEKHDLNFPLLADVEKKLVNAYGVWVEKSMYGKKYMGIQRDSFLIGADGVILKHYEKVKPELHAAEVLADVKALGKKTAKPEVATKKKK